MGFPHSEISGSTFATNSPDLFAGNRVLHRLQAPRHSPCALCSLTYKSSIQPSPRGRADAVDSPINTIGTNFAVGETRNFVFLIHLLRCTTCSFERAHGHHVNMRGLEQTNGSCFGSASPSSRRNTGADLESYGQTIAQRYLTTRSGAEETRTPDFLLAKEALYQLSYGPR
jgi:hypothetical protein